MTEPPPIGDPNSARLYVIIARKAPRAVVFRRGPVRLTRLLVWNLDDDTLIPGQWFRGRIYERRGDLSPDGQWLAYFAAIHHTTRNRPHASWTAISRPPYVTALAFWPKGDTWGGGGLFDGALSFSLNQGHSQRDMTLADDTPLPAGFKLGAFGSHPGGGEDDPIMSARLMRDGWTVTPGTWKKRPWKEERSARISYVFDPPAIRTMNLTRGRKSPLTLRVMTHGRFEKAGRSYVETADLIDAAGRTIRDFGRIDWIDADHNGDILLAREGKLERLPHPKLTGDACPHVVADLNNMQFEAITAPRWARTWNAER